MSDLYFNEASDYSEENTNGNENFCSTILQPFQFEPEQKKTCGNESHEKETKHIHASAANLLHIRKGNLDQCKYGHCKNEAREIDCLCCRELDAILNTSAKIPEHKGNISPCSFYGHPPDYQSHVLALSTKWVSYSFCSWNRKKRRLSEFKVLSFCFWC